MSEMRKLSHNFVHHVTSTSLWVSGGLVFTVFMLSLLRPAMFFYGLIAMILIVSLPILFSVERIVCLMTFYIIAFEIPLFKGDLYPISVKYLVIDAGLVMLILLLLAKFATEKQEPQTIYFGKYLTLFLAIVGVGWLLGLYYGNDTQKILSEFRILSYYSVYFVAVRYFKDRKSVILFASTVLAATLLASIDAIYTSLSSSQVRFVSRQVHMFLLVTPFLVSLLILDRIKLRKLCYAGALLPIAVSVVVSQTRGTWVAMVITVFLAILLSAMSKFKGSKRIGVILLSLVLFASITAVSLNFIAGSSAAKAEFVGERVGTIMNISGDHSLLMRANSYLTIIRKIMERPWIGNGLGDTATYKFFDRYSTQNNVDSTYLTILWKMGIIGLLPFIAVYILILKQAFLIYRRDRDMFSGFFSVGILAAVTSFLILGTISPILITSRFNFLFALLFAITETVARQSNQREIS
ncbi:O-antigen ligase family protein [bacterium]|nr:O-antigen ligase family protein [bacterium]